MEPDLVVEDDEDKEEEDENDASTKSKKNEKWDWESKAHSLRTCPSAAGDANATNRSPSNQTLAISPQSDARHKPLRPSCV